MHVRSLIHFIPVVNVHVTLGEIAAGASDKGLWLDNGTA